MAAPWPTGPAKRARSDDGSSSSLDDDAVAERREEAKKMADDLNMAMERFQEAKKKLLRRPSERSGYLTLLHEKVKRPAQGTQWTDEWTSICIEHNKTLQKKKVWEMEPDNGESFCTERFVNERDSIPVNVDKFKSDIDERVEFGFSPEDAEAYTVITSKRGPIARALREGKQTYAASLYKVVDVLQAQLMKQQSVPCKLPPFAKHQLVQASNGSMVAPLCYRHLKGKSGLVESDERWAEIEQEDRNHFRGITSSAVTEAWRRPDNFSKAGFVHHTSTREGPKQIDIAKTTPDEEHGIVLFRSSPDANDLIHSGIVTNRDRVVFPPHTLFALEKVIEPGCWAVEGIAGVDANLRPNQTLYVVSATYRKPIPQGGDDSRHYVSLEYGDRSAYMNNVYDITATPLLTMEEEFQRDHIGWVDRYGKQYKAKDEYEYVCGTAKAEDCGNGSKRDENNDGMTLDDFVEKINAHVKERREALNSEESNDDEFRQTLDEDDAELTKEEVIAVRLYSGPAYQPINEFLRQVGKLTGDYRQIIANSPKVTFAATVGHLCCAIRKLAAVAKLPDIDPATGKRYVYRGVRGALPKSFGREDESGWVVATDLGVMSTSRNREVPLSFMTGKENVLWKIECSPQRAYGFGYGADIALLSQFHTEDEILFPPWCVGPSCLEPSLSCAVPFAENGIQARISLVGSTMLRVKAIPTTPLPPSVGRQPSTYVPNPHTEDVPTADGQRRTFSYLEVETTVSFE